MLRQIFDWIITLGVAVVLALGIKTYVAEARWIPSASMEPTLMVGDHLMVDKVYYKYSGIGRRDIVVFNPTPASGFKDVMIKRVIGLPGDEIQVKKGLVYINGQPLTEPYEMDKPKDDFGPVKVPEDSFFVMGDNRNNSADSRFWGMLPKKNLIGRAMFNYYPVDHWKLLFQP